MTNVEYQPRLRDHVRLLLGDKAKDMFTDAEIDSAIELHALWGQRTTETLICYSNKFRSSFPRPAHEILIDTPVSTEHTYRVDESTKLIVYTSGGTAPSDQDKLTISYVEINFNKIMADCFEILASKASKMAVSQSVGGISIDSSGLANEFRKQSQHWACKDQW